MSTLRQTSASDLRVALQLLGAAQRSAASLPVTEFKKVATMISAASKRIQRVLYRLEPKRAQLAKAKPTHA